jgi:hypothetical protein
MDALRYLCMELDRHKDLHGRTTKDLDWEYRTAQAVEAKKSILRVHGVSEEEAESILAKIKNRAPATEEEGMTEEQEEKLQLLEQRLNREH